LDSAGQFPGSIGKESLALHLCFSICEGTGKATANPPTRRPAMTLPGTSFSPGKDARTLSAMWKPTDTVPSSASPTLEPARPLHAVPPVEPAARHAVAAYGYTVAASIDVREIVVLGKIRGNVSASDRVDIRAEGALTGDVVAARISIEDGAYFKGYIDICKPDAKPAVPGGPPPAMPDKPRPFQL
jgi:hypothetical protein